MEIIGNFLIGCLVGTTATLVLVAVVMVRRLAWIEDQVCTLASGLIDLRQKHVDQARRIDNLAGVGHD